MDLSSLVTGSHSRGTFEERLKKVIDQVREGTEDMILFVDEPHKVDGDRRGIYLGVAELVRLRKGPR